ncbi:hypothetical protein Q4Q35_15110 [Flavivirga aquimarina]|uniref:SGNH/GDSL hydrolase family protein n=1 Tax=Flavivirga aquimarina TaxID=2027862 RepID=A0ABT8WDC0_9FLAO|nr:hypothetical protein [Flavivirga aquimarina]MDO5971136.1 hypothetical protein [Flavivirga aquimarina]
MLKSFVIKLCIVIITFIAVYLFFVDKLAKGFVDPHYNKFTQEAGSLILGLSRANVGISPFVIEEELKKYGFFDKPLVNFAFNEAHFGEVYYNVIKKKIKTNNGIFIISISPGNFTAPSGLNDEKVFEYDERLTLGKVDNVTSSPNYNYIMNAYGAPLYNGLHNLDQWNHRISHQNGWNEIKLKNNHNIITDKDIEHWKSLTVKFYNEKIKLEQLSTYRYNYFIKTIEYLKTKGKVFLTRMPSHTDLLKFENEHWGRFDFEMDSIANLHDIPYLNYSKQSNNYKTYDGSHLESESAKRFTKRLATDIKTYLSNYSE